MIVSDLLHYGKCVGVVGGGGGGCCMKIQEEREEMIQSDTLWMGLHSQSTCIIV